MRLAIVFLLLLPVSARAATPSGSFTLPFQFVDNRLFVEAKVNDRGPFHFIFDTGGSAVVSDSVAARLGIDVKDAGEGDGVGASKQHMGEAKVASLTLGGIHLSDVDFSVTNFDDSPQVFGRQPVDGILGREIFERMVVKVDYVHHMLTFTPPDEYHYDGSGTVIPFQRPRQIPVIQATLDGVSGQFGVDTGARSAMLLYGPFCETNQLATKYGAKLEGVTGWGLGGPVRSLLARAHELDLGGVAVHDLVIRLSTQKTGLTTASDMSGLIGPDVLSQFDVTFDYARSRIILEKSAHYGRRDTYDRAGVWMGQKGPAFTVVDVIAGGPGDQAGVHAGDTILAVDGHRTDSLSLPEVREQMRRKPIGTKVKLLLESDGKQRTAVITLRDLA
jgi:hypothetical protein